MIGRTLSLEFNVMSCILRSFRLYFYAIIWLTILYDVFFSINVSKFLTIYGTSFRYTIREEQSQGGVLSTISIKRTQRDDSALFTCVATNAFGSDDTSINLIIQEKPEAPTGLKVLEKRGRTVKLSWQAPYNGNSNLTRYIIELKPTQGSWRRDIDRVLVPGDQVQETVFRWFLSLFELFILASFFA